MTHIIILAAGKGTRMKSELPKVLHKIGNLPMLMHVVRESVALNPKKITIIVSTDNQDKIKETILSYKDITKKTKIEFKIQHKQLGTANAVNCGIDTKIKQTIILFGDTPLVKTKTIDNLIKAQNANKTKITVLGFETNNNFGYGRLVLDNEDNLLKIIEEKDANKKEKQIKFCNSGIMAFETKFLADSISKIKNNNKAQEFYLTDIIQIAEIGDAKTVKADYEELQGVNTPMQLENAENIFQNFMREYFINEGVKFLDSKSCYFSFDTKIGTGSYIEAFNVFGIKTNIGKNCNIKAYCHFENVDIGNDNNIGPFARIRPGTNTKNNVKIGNFVEVKKSVIKENSKINHLSYIGDAEIGKNVNIGAGAITCNYDGINKHKTIIGDESFIGSNTTLIAPLNIGKKCLIAAGSVITEAVKSGKKAFGRARQVNK